MKAEWGLSDKQLGALVSVVSVTVARRRAAGGAVRRPRQPRQEHRRDGRASGAWRRISCMFTRNYGQLLAARAVVGLGEAGYGSVGAALIASHFPAAHARRAAGRLLRLGLGRLGARRDARRRDRRALGLAGRLRRRRRSRPAAGAAVPAGARLPHRRARRRRWTRPRRVGRRGRRHIVRCAGALAHHAVGLRRRRRAADRGVGAVVVAAELPEPRPRRRAGRRPAMQAALVVLAGAVGSVVWGARGRPRRRAPAARQAAGVALLCLRRWCVLVARLRRPALGIALAPDAVRADRCSAAS